MSDHKDFGDGQGTLDHNMEYASIHTNHQWQEKYSDNDGHESPSSHLGEGVNVKRAEAQFAALGRTISQASTVTRLSRTKSQRSMRKTVAELSDVEKAIGSDSDVCEPFDLESTLRNSKAMEDETGIKGKRLGVLWEDLTVNGIGGARTYVKTFVGAWISFFNVPETIAHILGVGKKSKEISILSNFRGVATPGELVLVLGRPGSGCTSFLKVIANQRHGYSSITGDVSYGPFDSKTFADRYRGEAVYNMEDDVHHPTLTVGQTLGFALDTKIGGLIPGGMSAKEFKTKIIDLLLKMFGIEHTRNTFLGNQFIRGVSGGERKRVSIAEMLITGAPVCCWDNSTRGLDSSSALDYVKSLRIMTNIYEATTFVSLYQASETIYEQFDKVLVIDGGRQIYYGPASNNAPRRYFESLGFLEKPRQTSADFLTGCTDPFEREFQAGRDESNVPSTPMALEKAFNESFYASSLAEEMSLYKQSLQVEKHTFDEFQAAVSEGKRGRSKKSVYTIPFHLQVFFLFKRQFFLKFQDRFNLFVSWVLSLTIAIVLGTVWLNLPQTSAGAFTRGGLLFIALLFNAFQAFSELASTMLGRPLQNKHRAYAFHRPSALWIAQIGVDLLFASAQILVFSVIVYFMTGLVRTPGAFFTFVLIIITGYLSMTLVFRTIGCLCPDFDYAIKFASTLLPLLVMNNGYLIQSPPPYFGYIFYINNLGLGFSALMMNEFKRINLTCTNLIPNYGSIDHQSCTIKGSAPGNPVVSGTAYIESTYNYNPTDLWRNYGIILILIAAFLAANVFLGEFVKYGAGGKTVTLYARETKELKSLNEDLQMKRQRRLRKEKINDKTESALNIVSDAVLTWEDVCYDVPIKGGTQKRLLNHVYGYVEPGKLTALMGASGAGKTTLLDVLASRKNIGVISGDVLVDGLRKGNAFQRGTSYAEQLDLHESTQTVREALRFSANLRQPYETPQAEKYNYVEEIISLLEMEDIADAIIGSPDSGLAVEQRKRVTIGVELAAKPELLLFLDEPTSGLDSQSAFNIIRFLKKLAAANQAILCTIHQPNSALFEMFDRLLLLQKGGECVYFGPTPQLIPYFGKYGAHCPPTSNPAEWMLDAIGAGQRARFGDRDWADIWRDSDEFVAAKNDIVRIKQKRLQIVDGRPDVAQKEYATPLWHQIQVVSKRTHLAFWRSSSYGFTRCFNHGSIAVIAGLTFLQLGESRSDLQYRVFNIFLVTVLPALILAQVEPKYDMSRLIFYRESAAKAYKQLPFALSMVLAEMPYSILCSVIFFLPLYYIPGFNPTPSRAGYQYLMVLITEIFAVTLGQTIAALTPSSFISSLVNPFIVINFGLFCGVTIPSAQMPKFWKAWLYQLDPFTRLIGGMVVTELHGLPVVCDGSELNNFTAPAGQNCGDYMAPFFAEGGAGYLVSNTTQDCSYCAYKVGDQFYDALGYSFSHRWRDMGILAAFIGSNLALLFLGSRYLNFNRR